MTTRIFNALLAVWLLATAFIWPHNQPEAALTVICAVLAFVMAIASFYTLATRYGNIVVAAGLFIGTLALPPLTRATAWNNVIVAVALLVSSLLDRGADRGREGVGHAREMYGRV